MATTYPGGKGGSGVAQAIINQIPPHEIYIEPFLGAGAIMRVKRPAAASIGIDSDAAVISQWRVAPFFDSGNLPSPGTGKTWTLPPGGIAFCDDAISALKFHDWQGGEFVYCDPPYLFSTRSSGREMYEHEFGTPEEHKMLIDVLKTLPCSVALSGYWSPEYAEWLPDWRTIHINTTDRAGNKKTEWLWMNYPQPEALHDYSFLGGNFRERERLTRIRKRWVARIQRMDPLERLMLSAAIAQNGDGGRHQQK